MGFGAEVRYLPQVSGSEAELMPWTRKQVKLFLSHGSPLSAEQQEKLKHELHANPKLGHAKKGSPGLK